MNKSDRKRIIAEDRKAIAALKSRGTSVTLPFTAEPDDHCETSPSAYGHIAPVLKFIADKLGKRPCDLRIYDPYYCAGGMVRHLNQLGFANVYNKCEDFYEVISQNKIPPHDAVLTNPPYSGDHFDKLLTFLEDNNKPALLLLPEHFSKNKSASYSEDKFCFVTPPERYHYWTPEGMRPAAENEKRENKKRKQHRNLVLGSRNSPFASHWFICMEPLMTNEAFVSLVDGGDGGDERIKLVEGCRVHRTEESIVATTFKGGGANHLNDDAEKGKDGKKKRRRDKKKAEEESPLTLNYSMDS